MATLQRIEGPHKIVVGVNPNEADLAIASIDNIGTPGRLNRYVLKEYGYFVDDLPGRKELEGGFSFVNDPIISKGKPRKNILLVVVVDESDRDTDVKLRLNLSRALVEFIRIIQGKTVWIPLMGCGTGGLSYEESYSATVTAINEFYQEFGVDFTFLLSLPNDERGERLYKEIQGQQPATENEIENYIDAFRSKFHFVFSYWDEGEPADTFYEQGIWNKERGHGLSPSPIKDVEVGDILIVTTPYERKSGRIVVRAFGLVTNNPVDEETLTVDWKLKELLFNLEYLDTGRKTSAKGRLDLVKRILSHLTKEQLTILFSTKKPFDLHKAVGLLSDSEKGPDYLNISQDVEAFARVIAASSFQPPLAIALFGKWGSGKSFFMHKLKEDVNTLSNRNGLYCAGVAQIHFNAWSYMDANLWASIVTKIFEELNAYINKNSKTEEIKKEIEKELSKKLTITKDAVLALENNEKELDKQIVELQNKKKKIDGELKNKLNEVENNTIQSVIDKVDEEFKVKEKIRAAIQANDSIVKTEDELKKIIPEDYWDNPEKALHAARSKYTFLKQFFDKDRVWKNVLVMAGILLIIFSFPILLQLLDNRISAVSFAIPQSVISLFTIVGLAGHRALKVYKGLQPLITSFWDIKANYEKEVEKAIAQHKQLEKALEMEIEIKKVDRQNILAQILDMEKAKLEIDFKINNALATEALHSFIEKRSQSNEYKKHLGIISIIRRDFEILSDLFSDHNSEVKNTKFREKFKKPLERIVLYIDDLDRCPEENVVEVLEAVNLLMAFPLFVVVVGVDPRWVKNALLKKHSLQFMGSLNGGYHHNNGELQGQQRIETIEPAHYLEKIFQIPFHLKSAEDDNVKGMLKELALHKPVLEVKTAKDDSIDISRRQQQQGTSQQAGKDKANPGQKSNDSKKSSDPPKEMDKPEVLEFTQNEVEMMQYMSEIVGHNPRALKRFVNIFRVIKAHEEYNLKVTSSETDLLIILFLLALPLGEYRHLLFPFENYINNEENASNTLALFLQPTRDLEDEDLRHLKSRLDATLARKPEISKLQVSSINEFRQNYRFIKRFSFMNI